MPILNMIYWATWGGGWGWQPWANTIAYYPLTSTSTVNDMSWNSNTLTNNGGVTFGINAGVDCASFDRSKDLTATISNIPQWTSARTTSFWCYMDSTFSWGVIFLNYWTSATPYNRAWYPCYPYAGKCFTIWTFGSDLASTTPWTTGQRYNVVWTYDWTNINLYLNWVLIATNVTNLNTTWYVLALWNDLIGYLSNVIIEDKARTAQEISDYYDQTKWDYWIS